MKRAFLFLFTAALVLVVLATLWMAWALERDDRLHEVWKREVFDGLEPQELFPPRRPNDTTLALEELAAQLGLDFSTRHRAASPPDEASSQHWQRINEMIRDHRRALAASTVDRAPELEPELEEFLQVNEGRLLALRDLLLRGHPPEWEFTIEGGPGAPVPSFTSQLRLHQLLALAAHRALDADDPLSASGFLEAAWRLGRDSAENPLLIAKLIRLAQLEGELLVLRRSCSPEPEWHLRLASLELPSEALRAIQLDGWAFQREARAGRLVGDPELVEPAVLQSLAFYQRLMLLNFGETLQHSVERMRTEDPRTFDIDAFTREQSARIPRWSLFSRMFFPHVFDLWPRSVRTALVVEHTQRILAARARFAHGKESASATEPSRGVAGWVWVEEPVAGGVRIRLDGDLESGQKHPIALDFTVGPNTCRG